MSVSVNSNNIEIRVDRRTELLGIIQIISDYQKKYPHLLQKHCNNREYVEEIEKRFLKYKKHEVIKLFDIFVKKYRFSYDGPVALFLQLDKNYICSELDYYVFQERLYGDNKVYDFINLLPGFAKEIGFEKFYNSNKNKYQEFINPIVVEIEKNDIIKFLLDYYGLPSEKKYVLNLLPFQTYGNYGVNTKTCVYANISGRINSTKKTDVFVNCSFDFSNLLYHEFSHSFINPLTDKHALTSEEDPIFNNIFEAMQEQAYGNNRTIINEHIIRALTLRFMFHINKDIEFYNELLQKEKEKGFIYIENILESLIYYENNRNKYTNIDDFYPIIIKNIRQSCCAKKLEKNL